MKRILAVIGLASIGLAAGAFAQDIDQPSDTLPGFKANTVYESTVIDNVSPYSGDVGVVVPLGPMYPLSPGTSFSLKATASVKLWNFSDAQCGGPVPYTGQHAVVLGEPTLGVGWHIELGSIHSTGPMSGRGNSSWTYVSPDGGSHVLITANGLPVDGSTTTLYSRDGSNLRIRANPNALTPSSWDVDFPDGSTHHLARIYGTPTAVNPANSHDFRGERYDDPLWQHFALSYITDKFGVKVVSVGYATSPNWEFTSVTLRPDDPSPKAINFTWRTQAVPDATDGVTPVWNILDHIDFPSVGGTTQRVTFGYYEDGSQQGTRLFSRPGTGCGTDPALVAAPFLQSISTSDSTGTVTPLKYTFDYYTSTNPQPGIESIRNGVLKTIAMPTGGVVKYDYNQTCGRLVESGPGSLVLQPLFWPDEFTRQQTFVEESPAVVRRTECDPTRGCDPSAATWTNTSETTYTRRYFTNGNSALDFKAYRRVFVTSPDGVGGQITRRHIFTTAEQNHPGEGAGGMEVERRHYVGLVTPSLSEDSVVPARSIVSCYGSDRWGTSITCGSRDGSAALIQSTGGDNVRLARTMTFYGSSDGVYGLNPGGVNHCTDTSVDATKLPCIEVDRQGWDANAREFQVESTSTNTSWLLPDNTTTTYSEASRHRDRTTSWNADTTNWVLKRMASRTVSDTFASGCPYAPCSVTTTYGYIAPNPIPAPSGTVKAAFLQTATTSSALGNLTKTYTPANTQASPGDPVNETIAPAWDPSGSVQTTRAFQNGQLTNSQRQTIGWSSFQVSRDYPTGLITSSADPNSLSTSYSYDALGRLTTIQPPSETANRYCYYPYSSTPTPLGTAAYVLALRTSDTNCPANVAPSEGSGSAEAYQYDGFGRVRRHVRRLPTLLSGSYLAMQETRYDDAGHQVLQSEWVPCGGGADLTSCFSVAAADANSTAFSSFDPFGRPQIIRPPDGTAPDPNGKGKYVKKDYTDDIVFGSPKRYFTDFGEYTMTGGVKLGTATSTWTSKAARKDLYGRLLAVGEPTQWWDETVPIPTTPTYGNVWFYDYNTIDKLVGVRPSASSQPRTFTYNELGFLTGEVHPERCASTPSLPTCAPNPTTYSSFDALGNAKQKTEGGISFFYTFDKLGRPLTTRTDTASGTLYLQNDYDGSGFAGGTYPKGRLTRQLGYNPEAAFNASVEYDFSYSDITGRLSRKTTALSMSARASLITDETYTYNALGLVETFGHPRNASGVFSTKTTYSSGLPIRVEEGGRSVVNYVTYSASGALASYTAGNGVTTTIAPDDNLLPRPKAIATAGASQNFTSGNYAYDLAGNIKSIGGGSTADVFQYDANGRLTRAEWKSWAPNPSAFDVFSPYDAFGNINTRTTETGGVTLTTEISNNHLVSATYDASGNLTNFGTDYHYYDKLSRQFRYGLASDQNNERYFYDGASERIAKVSVSASQPSPSGGSLGFYTLAPCRILDTRAVNGPYGGPALSPGAERIFQAWGQCGIPSSAQAISANITTVPTAAVSGTLRAYPAGVSAPTTANATFAWNSDLRPRATQTMIGLAGPEPGSFALYSDLPSVPTPVLGHAIVDVNGYFAPRPGTLPPADDVWTITLRDQDKHLVTEYRWEKATGTTSVQKDYVQLGANVVATYGSSPVDGTRTGWLYYSSDHLGTPRLITNIAGITLSPGGMPRYRSFGLPLVDLQQGPAFAAMERDSKSGNFHDHARNVGAWLGRFLSPDKLSGRPGDPMSWNRTIYARQNPLKFVDPDGRLVHYADERSRTLFTSLSARLPSVKATLDKYNSPGAPDLNIGHGDAGRDLDGTKARGSFHVDPATITPDYSRPGGGYTVSGENEKELFPATGKNLTKVSFGAATLTISDAVVQGSKEEANVAVHELGHADHAVSDPKDYFKKDAFDGTHKPDGTPIPHDERDVERYATEYRNSACGRDAPCPKVP